MPPLSERTPVNKEHRLGTILVGRGAIDAAQLEEALHGLPGDGSRRLGERLTALGYCSTADVAAALAEQYNLPLQPLRDVPLTHDVLRRVPAEFAVRNNVLPLALRDNVLILAVADPGNLMALDDLRLVTKLALRIVVADSEELRRLVEDSYLREILAAEAEAGETGVEVLEQREEDIGDIENLAGQALVVQLVNMMLRQAVAERASDIHIEPFENDLRIRFRIDGVLRSVAPPSKRLQAAICSRIKIMADMNIAERRLPQDGRIKIRVAGRQIDLRISTLPTLYGESVVIRLLDRDSQSVDLGAMGFPVDALARFRRMLTVSYGIILATGPTGSGKTTTLYAALQEVSSPARKVITIEDPVEYQLPGINQMHVHAKIGLTFAEGLRTILRQDPDVIMVGEIRDEETADIAIHAALTGHLVFSTLHTNDSAGAVARLCDMGIEPFLVASSLEGVVAQRLVRRLCPKCREAYKPSSAELRELGSAASSYKGAPFYRATGCNECRGTGYRGRVGLFELLVVDELIQDKLVSRASSADIKEAAVSRGMVTLREEGWRKVAEGVTTADEVARVTHEDEAALGVGEDDSKAG
ncbi:MAG: type II secretion system ATPase GspE [Armatimonadetes bacterium]|nr:type II secretion system ATPase GspE [Armatimonadota bacterium]